MPLSQFQGFSCLAKATVKGQWGHTIPSASLPLVMAWSVVKLRALEVDWMNAAGSQATTFDVERPAGDILASIPAGLSLAASGP